MRIGVSDMRPVRKIACRLMGLDDENQHAPRHCRSNRRFPSKPKPWVPLQGVAFSFLKDSALQVLTFSVWGFGNVSNKKGT